MTDLQKFIKLYKGFGIDLVPKKIDFEVNIPAETIVEIKVGYHEKVDGYSGFETCLYFDKHGKFLLQAIVE